MKPAVIVTGSSSGIGQSTAIQFANQGHDVVLVGRDKKRLDETASQIKTKSLVLKADLQNPQDCELIFKESIKTFPHLRILVNNAGIYEFKAFLKSSDSDWHELMETNLMGSVRLTRAIIPFFQKLKDGCVVNVASTAGLRPLPGMIAYSTSKAAIIHLTQSLALEYAKDNIKFHAVCPGVVATSGLPDKTAEAMAKEHPLGRVGTPEEIARAIYYLATQAEWMTGVVLPVDGGISLK